MEKEEVVLPADRPTSAAALTVIVREDVRSRPSGEATHPITTVGILGTVGVGIGGAVLTARHRSSGLLPYAVLAVALAASALIAGRDRSRRKWPAACSG
jgi:hypothetical protein